MFWQGFSYLAKHSSSLKYMWTMHINWKHNRRGSKIGWFIHVSLKGREDDIVILIFRLKPNQENYNCPTSCAYGKENDEDSSNVWCFKPGAYRFTDKCYPATTGETPLSMSPGETTINMSTSHMSTKGPHSSTPGQMMTTRHGRRKWHVDHMLNNNKMF